MPPILLCFAVIFLTVVSFDGLFSTKTYLARSISYPTQVRCVSSKTKPDPVADSDERTSSDRFVAETRPILIKRATVWTGENNGTDIIHGDVLLDKGIIQGVGRLSTNSLATYGSNLIVIDANGAWITPGLVNIRSHHGILPSPRLEGTVDANSLQSTIQPWLRSLDALNTHDDGYLLSIAGGTTTALVLPPFTSAVGGEGYVIKLRDTSEHSPTSMLLEPHLRSPARTASKWRYAVHACDRLASGDQVNDQVSQVLHIEYAAINFLGKAHNNTRMDNMWALRQAYIRAKVQVQRQGDYCSTEHWPGGELFPEDYEWELLAEILRGNVKVHVHCNEAEDLDGIIRLSQEFQFPIAVIHSASDAYLVPEVLKRAYGKYPAVALTATPRRERRDKYRASEFAPRILVEHGLTVLMQSQRPEGTDARYLLYEAQKAFFYGLPANWAIASVTSMPAEAIGMSHRIGYVKRGWDADLVIWDSHPMALGATPSQVIIDGIPQLGSPYTVHKSDGYQKLPKVPNFDKEVQKTIEYDGLPPLLPRKSLKSVVLTNVTSMYTTTSTGVNRTFSVAHSDPFSVVVASGKIVCYGSHEMCLIPELLKDAPVVIDLQGGSVSPAFISFGSSLGLENIKFEPSTNDGMIADPLLESVPVVIGGDTAVVHAVDGLQFSTRGALLAYRAGVTSAIAAPSHKGFYAGLSVQFSTDAMHRMEKGAIRKEPVAIHVSIGHFPSLSVSTQISALRRLLSGFNKGAAGVWFSQVVEGTITLVVEAHNADVIATLIILKQQIELENRKQIKMTITGATEAHKLAKELAEAHIGIIITPWRQLPKKWESRRILPGPPLTRQDSISVLLSYGVLVGIGVDELSSARDLRFDVAWAVTNVDRQMSKEEALALASTNIERLLGLSSEGLDLVVTRGGDMLDFGSEVVGIISQQRGLTHIVT